MKQQQLNLPARPSELDLGKPGLEWGEGASQRTHKWYHWFCLQTGSSPDPCSHSSGCKCNLHIRKGQRLRHTWNRTFSASLKLTVHYHDSEQFINWSKIIIILGGFLTWHWYFQLDWLQRWGTVSLSWCTLGLESPSRQRSSPEESQELLQGPFWRSSGPGVFWTQAEMGGTLLDSRTLSSQEVNVSEIQTHHCLSLLHPKTCQDTIMISNGHLQHKRPSRVKSHISDHVTKTSDVT